LLHLFGVERHQGRDLPGERSAGMRPDVADADQQIAQVRREREAAIDTQDFEAAAALRDKEKELLTARASHLCRRFA
jgi:protein-arginine kinase activator protein McsA